MTSLNATLNDGEESIPLLSLRPHPDNPRIGQLPEIIESIRVNGWYGRVLVQRSTRYVIAGNHRLLARQRIQAIYSKPPTSRPPGWPEDPPADLDKIPVQWIACDDQTALRIMLADNRSSDLARYDHHSLHAVLDTLSDTEQWLEGTLYSHEDFHDLSLYLGEEDGDVEEGGGGEDTPQSAPDDPGADLRRILISCPADMEGAIRAYLEELGGGVEVVSVV